MILEAATGILLRAELLFGVILAALSYVIVTFVKEMAKYRRRAHYLQKLPGLRGHPILGGLTEFPGPGENGIRFMHERLYEYPRIRYQCYSRFHITVAICHPDPLKEILKTSEPKPLTFGGYFLAKPWLGEGLLVSGGKKWARTRRMLTPAFHFDILRPYTVINNQATDILLGKFEKFAASGEYFELFNQISLCTLDIILKCAFSFDDNVQLQGTTHPYVKAVQQLSDGMVYRMLRPWLYPTFIFYLFDSVGREFARNCAYVHKVAENVIKARRKTLVEAGGMAKRGGKYLDFLDILLTARDESGDALTDKEIRNEVDTFLFEGHDTTASGISWALYSLAQNPEWQRQCQEEIDGVLDSRENDEIQWDDLARLKTLTMCIKEALRLHTTVYLIERQTTKDMYLDGYFIPGGSVIDIHLYDVLHNPTVWEEPMKFRPERFLPENAKHNDSHSFAPFSAGPRNCIGQHFAMHEMKVVIARILRRFDLAVDESRPAKEKVMVVLKTEDGMYLKATKRKL